MTLLDQRRFDPLLLGSPLRRPRVALAVGLALLAIALSRAIVNAQHELAFRKRRVRNGGSDPEADPLVRSWRSELELLRAMN